MKHSIGKVIRNNMPMFVIPSILFWIYRMIVSSNNDYIYGILGNAIGLIITIFILINLQEW